MSQDGLAYSARNTATAGPTDWPAGSDWDTIAADPLTATWPTGWSASVMTGYADGSDNDALAKYGSKCDESTASAALNSGYASLVGATATAIDGAAAASGSLIVLTYGGYLGTYSVQSQTIFRIFYTITPPAGTVSVFVYLIGFMQNVYESGGTSVINPDPWRHRFYQSTTTPGTLTAADWDFGSQVASVKAPAVLSAEYTLSEVVELSDFTAGVTNYIQHRSDESMPSHLLGVTWGSNKGMYKQPSYSLIYGGGYGDIIFVYHDGT